MVGSKPTIYDTLDCEIASTIPKRTIVQEPWMRTSSVNSRPISFTEHTLCKTSPADDLPTNRGYVRNSALYFDSKPLASAPKQEERPRPQEDISRVIKYRIPKFLHSYPKPYPRRSNTIGNFSNYENLLANALKNNGKENFKSNAPPKPPRRHHTVDNFSFSVNHFQNSPRKNNSQNVSKRVFELPQKRTEDAGGKIPARLIPDQDQVLPVSCSSEALVCGCVVAGARCVKPSITSRYSPVREPLANCDVGVMTDPRQEILSVPRVVAASIKNYKDIPEDLFNSLPESSVDPSPEEHFKDEGNCEWKNMLEGRRALMLPDSGETDENEFASRPEERINSIKDVDDPLENGIPAPENFRTFSSINEAGTSTHIKQSSLASQESSFSPQAVSKEYLIQLERDLQAAGVYFRLPPPTCTSAPPVLSLPPHRRERPSTSEAVNQRDVSVALATLDASLEGFSSDSSSESLTPTRSRTASVVEEQQFAERNRRANVATCLRDVDRPSATTSSLAPTMKVPTTAVTGRLLQETITRFSDSIEEVTVQSGKSPSRIVRQVPGNKTVIQVGNEKERVPGYVGGQKYQAKKEGTLECLNLIEEVYVTSRTKEIPESRVQMNAFYPTKEYSMRPTSPAVQIVIDSDSGHESGATSPCGTLTGDDTSSPPPSPSTSKQASAPDQNFDSQPQSQNNSKPNESPSTNCKEPLSSTNGVANAVISDESSKRSEAPPEEGPSTHFVVVAIDFGTTYSGYAFSFTRDPESIHMMKKWEGGDPGIHNQKTPTIVLLAPDGQFHSLGFAARDTFHDLDPKEAQKWLYFDRFKMELHSNQSLTRDTLLTAKNGKKVPALTIFSHALRYFRDHAIRELSEQTGIEVEEEDVRWVITVPAIWSHPAKQFMRMAAYQAGMGSPTKQDKLLISLEPEAAAIYCRRLRQNQLLQDRSPDGRFKRYSGMLSHTPNATIRSVKSASGDENFTIPDLDREEFLSLSYLNTEKVWDWLREGTIYMVVDCGGGTVDITVHQMTDRKSGHLKELHKATGGPYGSIGVDQEFEELLTLIFGAEFMSLFKKQRSAAYVDLMIAFESRKRNASPYKSSPLNIALPFSFIDLYKRTCKKEVEAAIKKHNHLGIKWSSQGMLRIEQETMMKLFLPTVEKISEALRAVLSAPEVQGIEYMFLVGGFCESEILQKHIRDTFGEELNVIIPQGMGLAILRGAVQFGLDPSVVTVRRSRLTYGVGVLNRFEDGVHPPEKKVVAAGSQWCADILDKFVVVDESIAVGDVVTRSYTPATPTQKSVILHLYATPLQEVKYVTDPSVQRVGTLSLELGEPSSESVRDLQEKFVPPSEVENNLEERREITVHLKFGGTEVKASAVDHLTGQCVKTNMEFLSI